MSTAARLRRVRREALGVDVAGSLNLVGALLLYLSPAFLFPAAIALIYEESPWPFVASGAATAGFGWGVERATRGRERIGAREGFLVVSLTWLLVAAFGALPYLLVDQALSRPIDAYFESMSGFTTTGSSAVTDVSALPRSIAMWRQFTQWVGGMGIIVLALAVLPRLRVGGRQLFEAEAPGPEVEPLAATIRETARRLWVLYVLFTAILVAVLWGFGAAGVDERMNLFRAVAHAFTTMPTGGFSTEARSVEEFAAPTQWTIGAFMVVAGANFGLMYAALARRRGGVLGRDAELRTYVALLVAVTVLVAIDLAAEGALEGEGAVRHAFFQVTSIMTTTGYASTDFGTWPLAAAIVLVGLMFVGGSAGSTAGGIKVVRHLLIGRILRRELDQTVHPEVVSTIRLNRRTVDERTVRAVIAFVLLYVGLFALGALALVLDAARAGFETSTLEAAAAAATALANVGPAFGTAGPMGSFQEYPDVSKAVLIALMWLGRLEIIPVAVLFTKRYWRA